MQDTSFGHVGAPIPAVEIRLGDVDDMGYYSADGQVCGLLRIIFKYINLLRFEIGRDLHSRSTSQLWIL